MKKISITCIIAVIACLFTACSDSKCHINGTISTNFDGKKVFLVPLTDTRAQVVDSVVIKDGKFSFVRDTLMMAKILVDYHYRMGIETLLVVVEPGTLNVSIDSVSSAMGTPQNDSLQQWKVRKQQHDKMIVTLRQQAMQLMSAGDSIKANELKAQAHDSQLDFKKYTRQLAQNVKEQPLHDFLSDLFPLTYKRMMPDSTVVEFDADTNEPINK